MRGAARHLFGPVGAGLVMGILAVLLAYLGNPVNTGICISCFMETSVGALGLHQNSRMWYLRPELGGFFLGSFAAALLRGEFKARTGGAGLSGIGLGMMMIVGSAVFIGCPIKLFLRLSAGDLTAFAGLAGLPLGVWLGLYFLRDSDLGLCGKASGGPSPVPWGLAALVAGVTALAFFPGVLRESTGGGGALHAPMWLSLGAGLLLGALCQGSRFCVTGQVRDALLTRQFKNAYGLLAFFLGALLVNGLVGSFNFTYYESPGVHLEWWWSLAGMALVGWAAVLCGGCPFRQLIKAGEGDMEAATITVGMVLGAVLVETWGLGSTTEGTTPQGRIAVLVGFAALFALNAHRAGKTA